MEEQIHQSSKKRKTFHGAIETDGYIDSPSHQDHTELYQQHLPRFFDTLQEEPSGLLTEDQTEHYWLYPSESF